MILKQNYVLVKHEEEIKTKCGIILAVQSQEKTLFGVIEKIGDAVEVEGLKVGQRICYDRLNASPIEFDGITYDIIEDSDIIAIM